MGEKGKQKVDIRREGGFRITVGRRTVGCRSGSHARWGRSSEVHRHLELPHYKILCHCPTRGVDRRVESVDLGGRRARAG